MQRAIFLIEATKSQLSEFRSSLSQSLARRLQRPSQANVLSTTHRFDALAINNRGRWLGGATVCQTIRFHQSIIDAFKQSFCPVRAQGFSNGFIGRQHRRSFARPVDFIALLAALTTISPDNSWLRSSRSIFKRILPSSPHIAHAMGKQCADFGDIVLCHIC